MESFLQLAAAIWMVRWAYQAGLRNVFALAFVGVATWMLLPAVWRELMVKLKADGWLGSAAAGAAGVLMVVGIAGYVRFQASRERYLKFTAPTKAGTKRRLED